MRNLFKFKYPKVAIFVIFIILAYFLFRNPSISAAVSRPGNWGYLGVFIAGILFAFGFTAPLAVGFFITLNPSNIFLAAIIGGFGALLGDLSIFKFAKISFKDEFLRLKKEKIIKEFNGFGKNGFGKKLKIYLMYAFAGFVIASPLPDEVGVTMLAGLTKIRVNVLAVISFILNTLGILVILLI